MGEEDSSWSSVGSGYSECPTEESTLEAMKMELATKDELLVSLQGQLECVKKGLETVEKDRESAVKLLQAALRTETILDKLEGDSTSDVEKDIIETIGTLVEGSEVLGVAELKEKVIKFGKAVLECKPSLAGAVLVACDSITLDYSGLEECALEKLCSNPQDILSCGSTLSVLSAAGIEKVLKDPKMETNEYTMFEILEAWAKSAGANSTEETLQERRSVACKLVDHIALDLIDPTLLGTAVRDSGIVNDAKLIHAFVKQAPLVKDQIAYQTKRSGPVDKSRKVIVQKEPPKETLTKTEKKKKKISSGQINFASHFANEFAKCSWNRSKTELYSQPSGGSNMDTVVGRVMKTGTHKWSLRVEKDNPGHVCLGIASAPSKNIARRVDYDHRLGSQRGEWGFCCGSFNSCRLWYENGGRKSKNLGGLMVKDNSTVTFTLSLGCQSSLAVSLGQGCQNSLAVSVDGGRPVILFADFGIVFLGPKFQHDGSGFVPAASIRDDSSVRFLGFE